LEERGGRGKEPTKKEEKEGFLRRGGGGEKKEERRRFFVRSGKRKGDSCAHDKSGGRGGKASAEHMGRGKRKRKKEAMCLLESGKNKGGEPEKGNASSTSQKKRKGEFPEKGVND